MGTRVTVKVNKPFTPKSPDTFEWLTVAELRDCSKVLFGARLVDVTGNMGTFASWANARGVRKRAFNFRSLSAQEQQARTWLVTSAHHPPASILGRSKFEYNVASIREAYYVQCHGADINHSPTDTTTTNDNSRQPSGLMAPRTGPRWMAAFQIRQQYAKELALLSSETASHVSVWLNNNAMSGSIRRREIDWTNTTVQKRYRSSAVPARTRYEYNVSDLQKLLSKVVARERLAREQLATN